MKREIAATLLALSMGATPVMAKDRHIQDWYVNEPAVLSEISKAGYKYIVEDRGPWIKSDIPVPDNGTYTLPDGQELRSEGTLLTLLRDDQLEQRAIDDFDAEWNKEHGK